MLRVLKGSLGNIVDWETLFHNKTVHKQVYIFIESIMNIFSNFISNKYVTFDDWDPPWMSNFVKTRIKYKNELYNTYIKNGYTDNDYNMLQEVINGASKIINKRKEEFHYHLASKLKNPSTSAKIGLTGPAKNLL